LIMYEETLLALSRETAFRLEERPEAPLSERRNPACGDEVALVADLKGGTVSDLRFYAQGCAVSVASAAVLCRELNGLPPRTVSTRMKEVMAFFDGDAEWSGDWGSTSLAALGAIRTRPMRMACVRLPWDALAAALP